MIRTIVFIVALTASLAGAQDITLTATTRPMGSLTDLKAKVTARASFDQSRSAIIYRRDKQTDVVIDGQPAGSYEWVVPNSEEFSTGNVFTFVAQQGDGMFFVIDGKPQAEKYYEIDVPYQMSDDLKHLAFVARKTRGGQVAVVKDGVAGPGFDRIEQMRMDKNTQRLRYVGYRGKDAFVVAMDKEIPLPTGAAHAEVYYRPDVKHYFYGYRLMQQWHLVIEDQKYGPFDEIELGAALYSDDSAHWAMAAKSGGTYALYEDGKVIATADLITGVKRADDNKRLAYLSRKDKRDSVILDGQPVGTYDAGWVDPKSFRFSPDGKRFAYVIRTAKDETALVIDGQQQPSHFRTGPARFSTDGKRYAYRVNPTPDTTAILLDGKELSRHRAASDLFEFSPDNARFAYIAFIDDVGTKDKLFALYVDGVPGPRFLAAGNVTRIHWTDNNTLRFVGSTGDHVLTQYTVTVQPK